LKGYNHLIIGVINLDTMEFETISTTSDDKSFVDATNAAIEYCN
jgi:hypothetical protein